MRGQHLLSTYLLHSITLVLLFPFVSLSQDIVTVLDEDNSPLIGVHLIADSWNNITDQNGNAEIPTEFSGDVTIDYLGYKTLTSNYSIIKNQNFQIYLEPDMEILEEVVIVGRTNARVIDLPYNIQQVKAENIYSSNASTSVDALAINSGAYIQKSQLGGGSPVLRGFEANKVLLVVDGVRMNNAIYRNGHLQNAITIDPSILEQVEIIYGAGSLLYGSEALGGVIHFRTKSPLLDFSELDRSKHKLTAHIKYNTADNGSTYHIDHTLSTKTFGVLTSVSYTDRGDLRTGANRRAAYPDFGKRTQYVNVESQEDIIIDNEDVNLQVGTGYSQVDVLQKWVYNFTPNLLSEVNIQYSTSTDIPRYDNLIEIRNGQLRFAEWFYGPQKRLLVAPKLRILKKTSLFDKVSLIGSYQRIEESRFSRILNNPNLEAQIEDVTVFGLTIDFNKRLSHNQKLVYGLDIHHNDVQSNARAENRLTSQISETILTRYPSGGSQLTNAGIFIQHNWQNQDSSLVWVNGLRWTTQEVNLLYNTSDPFVWPDFFFEGIVNKNSALVGITGLNYQKSNWLIKASTGTSFRSPNVDDLAKIRVNGNEITVPNPDLDSEKVWNSEITAGFQSKKLTTGITLFYTRLIDAIVRTNFSLPNGETTFISGPDTLIVTGNVNAQSGTIQGISAHVDYNFTPELSLHSSINFQSGKATTVDGNEMPLGHIPPTYGISKLKYEKDNWTVTARWQYNGWKRIEDFGGSVDNPDLATIDGSPSWHTFGIAGHYDISNKFRVNLAAENLTDIHYRQFASGVSGAGRHVVLGLRYSLE